MMSWMQRIFLGQQEWPVELSGNEWQVNGCEIVAVDYSQSDTLGCASVLDSRFCVQVLPQQKTRLPAAVGRGGCHLVRP
jgi:hypothetical protein